MEAKVNDIIDGGATVFVAGLGVPRDVVDLCHRRNVLVVNMCGKVRHAIAAVEAGCDIVVAQGTEAGGHTGQVATMPLVPQIVDAVGDRVPVVAAGGIFDGRGLAAALTLGADGVWVGTRFIATPEARAVHGYKDALLGLAEDGTVVTRAYTGKTCRVVRNAYTQAFDDVRRHAGAVPHAGRCGRWRTAPTTSAATRRPRASTPTASSSRPARASAPSTSWCPRASSCDRFVDEAEAALARAGHPVP